jgi:hypothetical protein
MLMICSERVAVYKHQGAAAWLEDEGVFDSSDDIDIIPDSDDDDDQF